MVGRGVEPHWRIRAFEADVVAHLAVVEAHPPAGRVGHWDPLYKPPAVPHADGEAGLDRGDSASWGCMHGWPRRAAAA
jgi:hypothetical protein